jgi:hypothetical protein
MKFGIENYALESHRNPCIGKIVLYVVFGVEVMTYNSVTGAR